jgi:hypothetical protein
MSDFYVSTYCNFAHDMETGEPIDHECVLILPAALKAEQKGDFDKAIEIMTRKPMKRRSPCPGKCKSS